MLADLRICKSDEVRVGRHGPTDQLAPADQPSLSQVLAEIEGWPGQ